MPLPKPNNNESEDDFIQRCMGNDEMVDEYDEASQRRAVCQSLWDRNKEKTMPKSNERKIIKAREFKLEDEGKIKLIFGTMNVIDHDGDVTIPGAIGSPQKVRISAYNHSSWNSTLPVGKGIVYESGEDMVFEGSFFLNTQLGKDTYETIKSMDDLQEYSYGFDITEAGFGEFENQSVRFLKGLKIYEVSPVLLGAGIGTRTLDIKSIDPITFIPECLEAKSIQYADHAKLIRDIVNGFVKRTQSIAELRVKEEKNPVSDKNVEVLSSIVDSMKSLINEFNQLLITEEDNKEIAEQTLKLFEQIELREVLK